MKFIGNYDNCTKKYEVKLASLIGLKVKVVDDALDIYGNIVPGSFGLFSESDYMGKEEDLFFEADTALFYLYRVWIKERGLSRVGLPMLPIPGEDLSESFAEIGEPIQAFEIGEAEIEWILRYAKDPCDENNPYVHSLRGEKIFK